MSAVPRASEPRATDDGPMRDPKLCEECCGTGRSAEAEGTSQSSGGDEVLTLNSVSRFENSELSVSDLSDRQSVAKLRGVGSRKRPADSAVRKTPRCRVRRVVGRTASKARRRMAPGEQTGAPGRRRREPQRGTLGKQPPDPPDRAELRTGNEALERGRTSALERRAADHKRAGAGQPVPIRSGGKALKGRASRPPASIDLPDRRARNHHRHSVGADDGP
jgi:hypothetical protein